MSENKALNLLVPTRSPKPNKTMVSNRPFSKLEKEKNVTKIKFDWGNGNKREQWFLLRSDSHHDNPKCDRKLELKHLDEAKERDAAILDFGDIFCAMEGKGDNRAAKSLRPEHVGSNYLDKLVSTAADHYVDYAANWALMGRGNHEYSVLNHKETDLIERLAGTLFDRTGSKVVVGGFANWVVINFEVDRSHQASITLYGHHGYGGGGPVTKDMIQAQRKMAQVEGADVYLSGHVHESWISETVKTTLNRQHSEVAKTVWNLKLPTYKEEFFTESGGYHHEKGRGPKPLGAWWMHVKGSYCGDGVLFLDYDFIRAK